MDAQPTARQAGNRREPVQRPRSASNHRFWVVALDDNAPELTAR